MHCTYSIEYLLYKCTNASAFKLRQHMARCKFLKRCMDIIHLADGVSAVQSGLVLFAIDMRDGNHKEICGANWR